MIILIVIVHLIKNNILHTNLQRFINWQTRIITITIFFFNKLINNIEVKN